MIHARRINKKQSSTNSTKEKLENTVIRSSTRSVNAASVNSSVMNSGVMNMGQASSNKTEAFDEAFGKSRSLKIPFSRRSSRKSRHNISTKATGQKFIKRLILLAIVSLLAFALLSLSFRTKTLSIQGNSHLNTDQVQQLSKIYTGTPLLWVTERNVKNLLRNPWVDKVKINRVFPNTVTIDLIEKVPVAVLSSNASLGNRGDVMAAENLQINTEHQAIAYAADGKVLPNVSVDVLNQLTLIDGWGEDRAVEGLELLNFLHKSPELSVTEINYTPEGFEASFNYGLQEKASSETSFIMGQLQTPSLTLLKDQWSGFVYALATRESSATYNTILNVRSGNASGNITSGNAASGESNMADLSGLSEGMFIVPAPVATVGAGQNLDQETRRIVKRKYITIYGWGVSLSE